MKIQLTFSELLQGYFTDYLMRERGVSPHTVASYRDTFRLLINFTCKSLHQMPTKLAIQNFDSAMVLRFLNYLEGERGVGAQSRNVRLAAIHSFFNYVALQEPQALAVAQRILAIKTKRSQKKQVEFLTEMETETLLATPNQATWSGRRDRTLLLLAVQTGLRVSELTTLRWRDVVLQTGAHVRCSGKGRKTRCVPLRKETVAALRNWSRECKANPEMVVFPNAKGGPLSSDGIQYIVAKHATMATKACPSLRQKRVSPHVLRHSTAMHLLQHGVDRSVIALWLGHESPETTNVYLHSDLELKEQALAKLEKHKGRLHRYRPSDQLLEFLQNL